MTPSTDELTPLRLAASMDARGAAPEPPEPPAAPPDASADTGEEEDEAALESAAAPPAPRDRPRDDCGHVADDAGFLPRNPAVGACPCGSALGNTLQLWGPRARSQREEGSGARGEIHVDVGGSSTQPAKDGDAGLFYSPARLRSWPRVCIIGPDWPCLCVTFGLVLVPSLAWLVLVAPQVHPVLLACGVLSFLALLAALALTSGSDPGFVPKQTEAQLRLQQLRISRAAEAIARAQQGPSVYRPGAAGAAALSRYSSCGLCHVLRGPGTSHCYDCNVCVLDLDHHCPWTGKCIGRGNIRFFYAFLWMLSAHIGLVAASTIVFFVGGAFSK